jgi:hypothetical protein
MKFVVPSYSLNTGMSLASSVRKYWHPFEKRVTQRGSMRDNRFGAAN